MRQGFTNIVKKSYYSLCLFSIYLITILILVQGVFAESLPVLETSVSIIGDDVYNPGDSFHIIAEIRNKEPEGRIDVIVTYDVLDPKGVVVLSNRKTVAVETISSFAEEFTLPSSISEGTYQFRAIVTTLNGTKMSEASCSFNVMVVEEGEQQIMEYIIVIALVSTVGGLIFEHRRVSKIKVTGKDFKKFINEQDEK